MNEADQDGPLVGQSQADKTSESASSLPADRPNGAPAIVDIHAYIGSRLRKAFDDVASQPVPDRFLQLMQQLDKR